MGVRRGSALGASYAAVRPKETKSSKLSSTERRRQTMWKSKIKEPTALNSVLIAFHSVSSAIAVTV